MTPVTITSRPPSAIALTGFMGAGKSTVGTVLAEHLGWHFLDLDLIIEHRQHTTIPQLFRELGEPGFRAVESEILVAVLDENPHRHVLALGGGTFVQAENAKLLRDRAVFVVFLETPMRTMLARCCGGGESDARPLAADPVAFEQLYEQRLPFYRTADLIIGTDGRSAEDVAEHITAALRRSAARQTP